MKPVDARIHWLVLNIKISTRGDAQVEGIGQKNVKVRWLKAKNISKSK